MEIGDFDNLQSNSFEPDMALSFHFSKPRSQQQFPLIPELQPFMAKYEKMRKEKNWPTFITVTDHPLVHNVPKAPLARVKAPSVSYTVADRRSIKGPIAPIQPLEKPAFPWKTASSANTSARNSAEV